MKTTIITLLVVLVSPAALAETGYGGYLKKRFKNRYNRDLRDRESRIGKTRGFGKNIRRAQPYRQRSWAIRSWNRIRRGWRNRPRPLRQRQMRQRRLSRTQLRQLLSLRSTLRAHPGWNSMSRAQRRRLMLRYLKLLRKGQLQQMKQQHADTRSLEQTTHKAHKRLGHRGSRFGHEHDSARPTRRLSYRMASPQRRRLVHKRLRSLRRTEGRRLRIFPHLRNGGGLKRLWNRAVQVPF